MGKLFGAMMVVSMFLFSTQGFAQDKTLQPAGKVYVVYLNDTKGTVYTVENMEAVDFQGIKCLKATASNLPGWVKDTQAVYIPVDKVITILEYPSLDYYKTSIDNYNKQQSAH